MTTFEFRRQALKFVLLGFATALSGCGGSEEEAPAGSSAPAPAPAPAPSEAVWDPSPWLLFTVNPATVRIDMSITLPAGVKRGGTFGLAENSRPLPAGVTLTPTGILSVVNSTVGSTNNLVFTYSEPNT